MQYYGDIDSGRSSCSAGSCGIAPMLRDMHINASDEVKNKLLVTREASTNTDLRVSSRPRSCVGLLSSPDERDPFPLNRVPTRRNTLQNLFDTPRKGGLTSARSTVDIASSTRIEQDFAVKKNAVSLTNVDGSETQCKKSRPVQRAASRLYSVTSAKNNNKSCIGPEFIVRASQPVEKVDITKIADVDKRTITVVLLNGQRIEISVDPSNTTAGQIFETVVKREKYEHNFMLGLAVLLGGDFAFLPDDYKLRKVAPDGWYKVKKTKELKPTPPFTIFLKIKFFLPTNIAKTIEEGEWRYRVYLQLRRSTLEGQLATSLQNLIILAGYALHIEFGDFFYREHGSGDYFLLEHYLPEGAFANNVAEIKLRMKKAHESHRGMDRDKAILNYIVQAQLYRDYGTHFYSAIWATRDGFCRDVWLSIGPRGITLYSRNTCISALPKESNGILTNRIVLQSLAWLHIHTMHYNKKSLYIVLNSRSGLAKSGTKYKIKMDDNKSYFTFWLASLHHRLYLKLHAKQDFIDYMSDELSYPVSPTSSEGDRIECSNYQDSYNMAVRNQNKYQKRQLKKRFRMDIFGKSSIQKDKENEKPDEQKILQNLVSTQLDQSNDSVNSIQAKSAFSSNEGLSSSESCSLPRRQGVKMGTRAFHGVKRAATVSRTDLSVRSDGEMMATHSDSDDLSLEPKHQSCNIDSMKLLPARSYDKNYPSGPTAYVIESPKVYSSFSYNPMNENTAANNSLIEKLDMANCVQGERCFVTAIITRDSCGTLGMQVAEGSDGNVYIKSITPNGPTDLTKKLVPGDQIISVNGHTLLNMKYTKALSMLQSAPRQVELIVLQNVSGNANEEASSQFGLESKSNAKTGRSMSEAEIKVCADSIASELDELAMMDQEIINEEALKTIHALIKLTKRNLIARIREQSNMTTPNKVLMQKCLSDNKIYDESDAGNYSSQENTPQKKPIQSSESWRVRNQVRTKRRPLSLHIPVNTELSEKFFSDFENNQLTKNVNLMEKLSLNRVQTSLENLRDKLHNEQLSSKNVAVPRNFGLSRKWLGPVKYPVTPLKETADASHSLKMKENIVKKHFIYSSDDDQLFL